jgi:hypothetical protein
MSCVGCVDGKASDTCAKDDGDDEGHHPSNPSLPSLLSQKMMGRKRKSKMAIRHENAGVAGTGRASGWGLSAWTVVEVDDLENSEGSVPMSGLRLKTESGSSANWGRFPMDDRP